MRWRLLWIMPLLVSGPALWADDKPKADTKAEKKGTPTEQFNALKKQFTDARNAMMKAYQAAKDNAGRQEAFQDFNKTSRNILGDCLTLAKDHPKDPVAGDVLVFVVTNTQVGPEVDEAFKLLQNHVDNAKLYQNPYLFRTAERAKFLGDALTKIKDPKTKIQATFCLAKSLKSQNESGENAAQKKAMKEAESLFETVSKSPVADAKTKEQADNQLYAIRNIAVGKPVPDIAGEDVDGKKFKLSDYKGKVVLLDFWGNW